MAQAKVTKTVATEGRYAGKPVWLFHDTGIMVPVVSGGDGEQDPPAPTPPAPPAPNPNNPPAPTPPEKQYTQAEVNAMMAREKDQGKRSAQEELSKTLGVSIEEAKKIIEDAKAKADSEKSEAQLAREKADAEKADAEKVKSESEREKHNARVERALIRVLPKDLDDKTLDEKVARIAKLVEVEVGADADTIKAKVDELRKAEPALFGAMGGGGANGDPPGGPPKPKTGEDKFAAGRERAKEVAGQADGYAHLLKH